MATPTWTETPHEIGHRIASFFFDPDDPVLSLAYQELCRQICSAVEAERTVTEHYINQMGRWVKQAQERSPHG